MNDVRITIEMCKRNRKNNTAQFIIVCSIAVLLAFVTTLDELMNH